MGTTQGAAIGRVVGIWRYPVKSMLGEELNATAVTERGLVGDRAFALIDAESGKVASAKNPRAAGPRCSTSGRPSSSRPATGPRCRRSGSLSRTANPSPPTSRARTSG